MADDPKEIARRLRDSSEAEFVHGNQRFADLLSQAANLIDPPGTATPLHAPTLEAAARVADQIAAEQWSEGGHYQRDDYQRGLREHAGHKLTQAAAAIRALAKREN